MALTPNGMLVRGIRNSCLIYSPVSKKVIFPCPRTYTFTKTNSEVFLIHMEMLTIKECTEAVKGISKQSLLDYLGGEKKSTCRSRCSVIMFSRKGL